MPIAADWSIDYNAKRVYHSANSTVYSVNALYSFLMDTFDELIQMDDTVPMSAQTPNAYTMINGWFIDDDSVKYLNQGAIATSGWDNIVPGAGIEIVELDGVVSDPIAGDIGKMVHVDE